MTEAMMPPLAEGCQNKSVPVLVRLNGYPEILRVGVYMYSSDEWLLHQSPPHRSCVVTEWWPIPSIGSGIPANSIGEIVK